MDPDQVRDNPPPNGGGGEPPVVVPLSPEEPPEPPGNARRRTAPPPNEESSLYDRCFDGYKYRDQLVPQEFFWVSQLFGLFLTLGAGVVGFLESDKWLAISLVSFIGVVGFIVIWAFLGDMRANFQCKAALRWVMREMEEDQVGDDVRAHYYWQIIRERDRIVRERNERIPRRERPAVADWFLWATWGYLGTWIILVGIALVRLLTK